MSLICPHCGTPIELTLHSAFHPQRNGTGVVFTNIDGILEVGERFEAIFEEKHTADHKIPTYQIISLKRLGRALDVPLFVVFNNNGQITVYRANLRKRHTGRFYHFEESEFEFSGNLEEFKSWIYDNFLSHAPLSRKERRGGGRKEVIGWRR